MTKKRRSSKAPQPASAAAPPQPRAASAIIHKPIIHKPIHKPSTSRPLSALQQKLARRLSGGDFRQLNERLYRTTGAEAVALMRANPALFETYHAGYADQVRRWPTNPLDHVLAYLATQPAATVVADLGCGEARLEREARQEVVHSFDLVAANERVVACDIARTPLGESAVDVAVFCLSLMGTNYGDFLVEARRIVRPGGLVLVAEVASRFERQDPRPFKKAVAAMGFLVEDGHAFVAAGVGGGLGDGSSKGKQKRMGKKDKSQLNGKKRKRREGGGSGCPGVDMTGGSAAMSDSPFFMYFAFRTTKKTSRNAAKLPRSMPALKACVYKKR